MKIVILDAHTVNPGDLSWHPLEEMGDLTVYERTSPDETVERCKGAEIVLTNKVVLDADKLNQLPHLSYIGVLATGYNVVDLEVASRQSIVVTNIPAYSTNSVAQMVFAHILNITNRVGHYAAENAKGRWTGNKDFCYYDFTHTELAGKTMGIVGMGNTGMATARIAQAFGMNVVVYSSKDELPNGIRKVTMDEVFRQSDIVGEDTNILNYDDALDVSEYAIPAMQWAVGSGTVGGRTVSALNPKDTATRAEIATIIMRYCENIAGEDIAN